MDPSNPYAAPQSLDPAQPPPLKPSGSGGVWREGKLLVMHKDASLPSRCVKTNGEPDGGLLKRKLQWAHPALSLLVLIAVPVYLVVYLIVSKKATIMVPLSGRSRQRRLLCIAAGWLGCLGSIVIPILAGILYARMNRTPGQDAMPALLFAGGLIGFIAFLLVGSLGARVVWPKKMTDTHIWLNGVHADYLAVLPELPK